MDTKRMITGVLLITVFGLAYQYFILYEYRIHPNWKQPGQQTVSPAASSPVVSPAQTEMASATLPVPATTQSAGGWHFATAPGADEQGPATIGSLSYKDPAYHLGLTISPQGGGLDSVVLNQYRQEVDSPELFTYQTPYASAVAATRSLSTTAVVVDGIEIPTFDAAWTQTARTDHSVTYAADLESGDSGGGLRVEKQFILDPASDDPGSSQGYEVQVNYAIVNLSSQAHKVSLKFNGPTEPRAETARQETEVVASYDDGDGHNKVAHQPLSYFNSSNTSKDFIRNDDNFKLLWLGATSNYFNAIVHPLEEGKFASAVAAAMNPTSPAAERLVTINLTTDEASIAPGGVSAFPMRVFFGPKRRDLLGSRYYASFPLHYGDTLVLLAQGVIGGICGFCTFPWLISFLVWLLACLHFILRDWGLAIIALVCGVRLVLHPITKKSQTSMMKMQKLAPEMERLKKKFGDDKDGFQKAQVELYKGVGFTPILGCLPMFLQMPIFIALWRALQTTFELRQAPFLYFFGHHFTWIHDLSQPDSFWKFATPLVLLFGFSLASINLLPIGMAVVTYINQKYFTPKPMTLTPEQEQQQKMMTMMMPVMLLMFYSFPSGLNLYYLTSTSLGIIESKVIRNHIKRAEEEEKANGPVIVDAGKGTRSARRRQEQQPKPPKKAGWLATKMAELQQKAEEMARQAEQQKKKKNR